MASALKDTMNKSMTHTTLLFDLESTGLLRQGSQLHCIVARNADTGETFVWDKVKDNLDIGVEQLRTADVLVGHNRN